MARRCLKPPGSCALVGRACAPSSNCCHRPVDTRAPAFAAQAIGAREELEILGHAQRAVEGELLRDVPEPGASRGGRVAHVGAGHLQLAAARRRAGRTASEMWWSCRRRSARASPKIWPRCTSKSMRSTAVKAPNCFTSCVPALPPLRHRLAAGVRSAMVLRALAAVRS